MLIRIVRMTFAPEHKAAFLEVFEESKAQIRAVPGCLHLELWQDYHDPNVLLTHSHWQNDDALEAYRHSELFKSTWAKTNPLFAAKPVAFSSRQLQQLSG